MLPREGIASIIVFLLSCTFAWAQPSIGPGSVPGNESRPGTVQNATNTTYTSANSSVIALVNMSGNHTVTLPDPATVVGRGFWIMVLCNGQIGVTGNLTVNCTTGNVNRVDALVVTNTTNTNVGNVSLIYAYCLDSTYGYTVGVVRR